MHLNFYRTLVRSIFAGCTQRMLVCSSEGRFALGVASWNVAKKTPATSLADARRQSRIDIHGVIDTILNERLANPSPAVAQERLQDTRLDNFEERAQPPKTRQNNTTKESSSKSCWENLTIVLHGQHERQWLEKMERCAEMTGCCHPSSVSWTINASNQ